MSDFATGPVPTPRRPNPLAPTSHEDGSAQIDLYLHIRNEMPGTPLPRAYTTTYGLVSPNIAHWRCTGVSTRGQLARPGSCIIDLGRKNSTPWYPRGTPHYRLRNDARWRGWLMAMTWGIDTSSQVGLTRSGDRFSRGMMTTGMDAPTHNAIHRTTCRRSHFIRGEGSWPKPDFSKNL